MEEYNIELKNYDDSACMIYDLDKQPVYSGGSGPACLPLVTYTYIFDKMKKQELKKSFACSNRCTYESNFCLSASYYSKYCACC